MMNKAEQFGQRLRDLLKQHNLTQAALAKQCSFDPTYISNLCNGERLPSYENLLKLLDAFGDSYSKAFLVWGD